MKRQETATVDPPSQSSTRQQVTVWQLVMLFLSVYVLIALFVDTVWRLPAETSLLLTRLDNLVCIVFLADFFVNLARAPDRRAYLKWGWIDLLSSVPNIQFLRWGRMVRVIRIFRILRGVRSTKLILQILFANRAKGTFASVAMITGVVVIFSTIAILNCETVPESNIRDASDALWWAFVTVTTVGYGDKYPVTTLGRVVAAILMTAGVGLFGTFTAYVASYFVQKEEAKDDAREEEILLELKSIGKRLDRLEQEAPPPPNTGL